jgi:DNA-binding protein HU-beta
VEGAKEKGKEVSMHKTEAIKRVATETRLSQRIVSDVIDATHRLIEETLRAGEAVTFPGFGTFYPSQRQETKVRHIRTGRPVTVPARIVARFRVGEILKRAVSGKRRRR